MNDQNKRDMLEPDREIAYSSENTNFIRRLCEMTNNEAESLHYKLEETLQKRL